MRAAINLNLFHTHMCSISNCIVNIFWFKLHVVNNNCTYHILFYIKNSNKPWSSTKF